VLASVRNDESIGRSHYDGVNFSFRQRMSHRFQVSANYTLAWAYSYDGGADRSAPTPEMRTTHLQVTSGGRHPMTNGTILP